MAASELKRQEGQKRRRPSKTRNRARKSTRFASCKSSTEEEFIPVGTDGIAEPRVERSLGVEFGAQKDQFDTIDLSDNEIVKLEKFPYFLPKLHTLVLANYRLTNLVEIDPLASLTKLQFLSLLDNNITKKPNYHLYVIHKLKSLHVLDFKKVKHKEQIEAQNLFSSQEAEEQAKKESAKTFIPGEVPSTPEVPKEEQTPKTDAPTPEQIIAIKLKAPNPRLEGHASSGLELLPLSILKTLEEVARLEKKALKSGQLPADLKIGDDGMTNNEAAKEDKMVTDEQTEANDGAQEMLSLNRRIMNLQK
ncbi:hypothetical protein TEA_026326 [Camellia sinensis var. sinensis]|uniref:U2A'/phosphoprotein 32 family A C-terminal domain-containing protein n=1 Tax=Camellia sinensis var. sinensis TaxID=542762 RepID=A0A4S4ESA1_CAMSN|nr:hypothetical protein TEA_026326 [Camellia sinensis var. sinensis]